MAVEVSQNGGNPFGKGGDNLRRRHAVSKAAEGLTLFATLIAVAVLVIVVGSVFLKGFSALNLDFFFETPAVYGATGGGIANAIVGTVVLVLLASVMAVPVGILVAVYLSEFAKPAIATPLRVMLDVFTGIPSIILGVFVFALIVVGHGQSGWAGAFALALIMLPYVARGTDEVLTLDGVVDARGEPRARREQVVHGRPRDAPHSDRRHRHLDDPRDRARRRGDGAAAVRILDRGERRVVRPEQAARVDPDHDLHLLRVAESRAARTGLGGGADADRVRPGDQRARASRRRATHPQAPRRIGSLAAPTQRAS